MFTFCFLHIQVYEAYCVTRCRECSLFLGTQISPCPPGFIVCSLSVNYMEYVAKCSRQVGAEDSECRDRGHRSEVRGQNKKVR